MGTTSAQGLLLTIAAMLLVLTSGVVGQTDVRLRAERQSQARIPVELRACALQGETQQEQADFVVALLESDLWLSSLIAAYPISAGDAMDSISTPYAAMRPNLAIRTALVSVLAVQGTRFQLEIELVNSLTGRSMHQKTYQGCVDKLRLFVHRAADDVVHALTGSRGIAVSRIAFSAESFGDRELYVMDYDGVNMQKLTDSRSIILTPAWTKNGRGLVFTSYQRQNPDLYAMDIRSRKMTLIAGGHALYTSPDISPDGKNLVYVSTEDGNAELYIRQLDSGRVSRLTRHGAIDTSPNWSPDGARIVFSSDRTGSPQLYTMDNRGQELQRLPVVADYADSPVWSPRGDKIAFVSRFGGRFDIMIFDLVDESTLRLTQDAGSNEDPSWSADGYRLAFMSTRDGGRDIYAMMWDGSGIERLTVKGSCSSPVWSANVRPEEDYDCSP